jgi:hypothetical protein
LEPNDVDIFINGYGDIKYLNQYIEDMGRTNTDYMKYFMDATYLSMFFYRLIINEDVSPEELDKNIVIYQNFLNREIKEEFKGLDDIFIKIGWENGGHKKFWTIYYGMLCIALTNRVESDYTEEDLVISADVYSKITDLINDEDFKIINARMEDIVETMLE